MKLISLDSDKKSFRTIVFKDGLNLIVGKKNNPDDKNTKNTYNGVGKSLIIYLIHFCLGSNEIKPFKDKIPDWNFILKFSVENIEYTTTRNTTNQKEIFLNDESHSLAKFRSIMLELVFDIPEKIKFLTFNTLFPRFIRRDKECYIDFSTYINKEQEYQKLLNNSYLLDLNIELVIRKKELRELQTNTESIRKSLEKDPVLKEHFNHNSDTDIAIADLEEDINKLQSELAEFKIANNYDQIEKESNGIAYELKGKSNERSLIINNISNIQKSLQIKPDVSVDRIIKLYELANIEIPELIIKSLNESTNFHQTLLSKRSSRLTKELQKNKEYLKQIESEIESMGEVLDKLLEYLNTHGALDEYSSLNSKLSDLKIKHGKYKEYKEIMQTYKIKLQEIKKEYGTSSVETQEYIEFNKPHIDTIKNSFRELTKEFYDKGAGIKIESNDGENTLRYDIDVRIQDDSSDGVNEVKIFCYDLMMLLLQFNSKMQFVFHDSRLFSNMDPRQRGTVFKVVHKKMFNTNFQYIATVNQDQLESFRSDYSEDDFKTIIDDNIRLTLTDESSESKLLGIQIDMSYEK